MLDITRAYSLTFLIAQNDASIGRLLRNHGEFARIEADLIIDYLNLSHGGAYIDVGANIGTIALPVAAAAPKVQVIAIEAQRVVAGILSANAFNNHLYNVEVIHAAAGAEVGIMGFPQANLRLPEVNFGMIGADVDILPIENVRICTLDEIAPAETKFIKIDVEGFEPEVLKGARNLIYETRPSWLIEANSKTIETARSTMRTLLAANYRLFWFYAPFISPSSTKLPRLAADHVGDMNFLALPEGTPNIWDLPEFSDADTPLPMRASIFKYLERVGFRFSNPAPSAID